MSVKIQVYATGRRKSAVAQVKLINGTGQFFINKKPAINYLQGDPLSLLIIQAPIQLLKIPIEASLFEDETEQLTENIETSKKSPVFEGQKYDTLVKVTGGGLKAQAQAIQLGFSKALCVLEESSRKLLRAKGYLTRDPRCKERKKYGLKKARKAPQFSKR